MKYLDTINLAPYTYSCKTVRAGKREKLQFVGSDPRIPDELFVKIVNLLHDATSVNELYAPVSKFFKPRSTYVYHLPLIGAHDYNHMGRHWTSGIPQEVVRYLDSQKNMNEPVRNYIMEQGRPYWVSQLKNGEHQLNEKTMARVDLALNNMGDGILAPLFGPYQKRAYAYMAFHNPREFYDDIFIWQMLSLMQARHTRYCIIKESFRARIKLTPRESDVLELITFGKTNPEIGKVLGISSNTVTGYVKQIFLKLGVSDRVSAALQARSYHIEKSEFS